jgi:hypothetical protein
MHRTYIHWQKKALNTDWFIWASFWPKWGFCGTLSADMH